MRQILSLSLPQKEVKNIKTLSKKRGFNSVSAYLRYLFELDKSDLISEEELLKDIEDARKEYKAGKAVKFNSLAELL
ncbi:MAG: hypothetical protein U9P90_03995 [Patescibacteria group bacterium]|nr:hypothetical protein [Patescibacteria group bacterium]